MTPSTRGRPGTSGYRSRCLTSKLVYDGFLDILLDMNTRNQQRNDRISALEQRCAELESTVALAVERVKSFEDRPGVPYDGVWSEAKTYARGVFVTFAGSLWHSESASVSSRPGTDPTTWKLAVKRGADGKDLRSADAGGGGR